MQKNKKNIKDINDSHGENPNTSPTSESFLKCLLKDKKFVLLLFTSLFFFGTAYLIEKGYFEAVFHKIDGYYILSEGKRMLASAENDEQGIIALEKISEAQSYQSAEFLAQVLRGEETHKVRAAAAKMLGRQGIYDFEDDLIEALKDPFIAVRVEAAKALGEGRSWKAVSHLIKALEDDKTIVQDAAHSALYVLCLHRNDYSPLIEALKSSSLHISYRAVVILGELKAKDAVSHITPLLKNENAFLREKAVIALGEIGDPASIPPLKEMLLDPEEDVIIKVLQALSKIEGTEDILEKALLHESERVRTEAAELVIRNKKDIEEMEETLLELTRDMSNPPETRIWAMEMLYRKRTENREVFDEAEKDSDKRVSEKAEEIIHRVDNDSLEDGSFQNGSLRFKTLQEEYDEYMSRLKEAEEKGEAIVEIKVPGLKQLKEQHGDKVGERMYEIYKAREKENNKNMRIIFEDEE